MNQFSFFGRTVSLVFIFSLTLSISQAQTISSSPESIIRPFGPNNVQVTLTKSANDWGSSGNYVWSVSPAVGVTIGSYTQTGAEAATVKATFTAAANGPYTFKLTRGTITSSIVVYVGNLAASTIINNNTGISSFSVLGGGYNSGPSSIFSPAVPTAALGLSQSGYFYYLPNTFSGNDGKVTVYAARPDGSDNTPIGYIDLNGASNNDLGFVRLAIDQQGIGWILAGDNSTIYLGRFTSNGINPITVTQVDPNVDLVNGTAATFFNGDIAFSGTGAMFCLANNGSSTQIFIGNPNGANTTLTKKWDLVNENGTAFNTSVNGVAFDVQGNLYVSSGSALYFIDQNTVNTGTGTVKCALVRTVSGLTDLASNYYPAQSALPVTLLSFTGVYNAPTANLNWETASEVNFDHFDIERSSNGTSYSVVGSVQASGGANSKQEYLFADDLSSATGNSFSYRLKMVDKDGTIKYSSVITIRKETTSISGLTLNPMPVTAGSATLRFSSIANGKADIRIVDLTGKTMLRQSIRVYKGNNSVALTNLSRLYPGNYVVQILNGDNLPSLKFSIAK